MQHQQSSDQVAGISRRRVLKFLAAGAVLPSPSWAEPVAPEGLLHRTIPGSGERLPVIGLSTSRVFDVGSEEKFRGPVREVLRLIAQTPNSLVDTSPKMGRSENVVGDMAAELGVADGLFLASKIWTHDYAAGILQMQRSGQLLRRRTIDLMQIHNLVDWRVHLRTLQEWKEQERIRYIGISHYHRAAFGALEQVLREEEVDFLQLNYSLAEPEADYRLLSLAADRGVAVIVNRPLAEGFLARKTRYVPFPAWAAEFDCENWDQFFVKYVIAHPAVTCAISATAKPEEMANIIKAARGRLPDSWQRERMLALIQSL